jgi:hypothetical protein
MNVLNSSTKSDVNIVGNKSEEEQKFSMHQVDQENVKGKRKEKVIDNQTRQENVKGRKRVGPLMLHHNYLKCRN